jgi:hypothetical protein
MVLDEAPAATTGGFNGKGNVDRAEIGSAWNCRVQFPRSDPTSLVAAEIHLGCKPAASATAGRTATFKLRAMCTSKKYRVNSAIYTNFLKFWRACGR